MPTALSMITRAMRLTGNVASGATLDPSEAADGLDALNTMLDSWSTQNMFVYVLSQDTIALTANLASYTIGPTGSTVGVRPVEVDVSTYFTLSGVSYPLKSLTTAQYNTIPVKTQTGIPQGIWYNTTFPNGTITLYPVPSQAMTLQLWSSKVLQSFPTLTTDVLLPPGYKRAIELSLAEEYAPEFLTEASRSLTIKASSARRSIKRVNLRVPLLQMPSALTGSPYNIIAGG